MVAAPFRYERVSSFEEAAQALRERGEEAKVLAGGQSLVPMLNLRLARPGWLIDINPVGAGPIEDAGGHLRLPALTRQRGFLEGADALVAEGRRDHRLSRPPSPMPRPQARPAGRARRRWPPGCW
jgi:hypothetical protein